MHGYYCWFLPMVIWFVLNTMQGGRESDRNVFPAVIIDADLTSCLNGVKLLTIKPKII